MTWVETRSENLLALPHGRSQVQYVEMGFTRDGCITGLHASVVGDAGAYGGFGGLSMGPTRNMAQGVYRIPKLAFDVAVAVTNTTPMGAFGGRPRGGGLPRAHHGSRPTSWTSTRSSSASQPAPPTCSRTPPWSAPHTTAVTTRFLDRAVEAAGYADLRSEQARCRRPATAGSSASA